MIKIIYRFARDNMIASIIISLLIVFGLFHYFDKQQYTRYMSHDVNNDLGNLNYSIIHNDEILGRVLESKEMSHEEVYLLDTYHENIYSRYISLERMAKQYLHKASKDEISNFVNNTAYKFHRYFKKIRKNDIQQGETIQLDEKQIEQIKFMKVTNKIWLEEVKNHLESLNNGLTLNETLQEYQDIGLFEVYNRDRVATKNHWITLIKNLSTKTENHQKDIFPRQYHSLESFLRSSE